MRLRLRVSVSVSVGRLRPHAWGRVPGKDGIEGIIITLILILYLALTPALNPALTLILAIGRTGLATTLPWTSITLLLSYP